MCVREMFRRWYENIQDIYSLKGEDDNNKELTIPK